MNTTGIIAVCLVGLWSLSLSAQHLNREEANEHIKELPSFSIHKNNYFITGVPTNKPVNSSTSDIKYQISFKQMITRSTLPWDSYLFVTYSQKAFWGIYEDSSPFKEINFNPSIGLGKPVFDSNDRLTGLASLSFSHESNGRDSIYSRSWNRLDFQYSTSLGEKSILSLEAWVPFQYKEGNPDILDYEGVFRAKWEREFIPDKLTTEITVQKGLNWDWKGKIRTRVMYSPFKSNRQYLMLEWYAGQSESLIDYDKFTSMLRIGYIIKTNELDFLRLQSDD